MFMIHHELWILLVYQVIYLLFVFVYLSFLFSVFRLFPQFLVAQEWLINNFKALLCIFEASPQSASDINIKLVIYEIKYLIRNSLPSLYKHRSLKALSLFRM